MSKKERKEEEEWVRLQKLTIMSDEEIKEASSATFVPTEDPSLPVLSVKEWVKHITDNMDRRKNSLGEPGATPERPDTPLDSNVGGESIDELIDKTIDEYELRRGTLNETEEEKKEMKEWLDEVIGKVKPEKMEKTMESEKVEGTMEVETKESEKVEETMEVETMEEETMEQETVEDEAMKEETMEEKKTEEGMEQKGDEMEGVSTRIGEEMNKENTEKVDVKQLYPNPSKRRKDLAKELDKEGNPKFWFTYEYNGDLVDPRLQYYRNLPFRPIVDLKKVEDYPQEVRYRSIFDDIEPMEIEEQKLELKTEVSIQSASCRRVVKTEEAPRLTAACNLIAAAYKKTAAEVQPPSTGWIPVSVSTNLPLKPNLDPRAAESSKQNRPHLIQPVHSHIQPPAHTYTQSSMQIARSHLIQPVHSRTPPPIHPRTQTPIHPRTQTPIHPRTQTPIHSAHSRIQTPIRPTQPHLQTSTQPTHSHLQSPIQSTQVHQQSSIQPTHTSRHSTMHHQALHSVNSGGRVTKRTRRKKLSDGTTRVNYKNRRVYKPNQ